MFGTRRITFAILLAFAFLAQAQTPRDLVRQAVQTELVASANDHSHWLYFEINRQPATTVKRWVAQATSVSLQRVIERDGRPLPESEQRQEMSAFINDSRAQARQRKSGQHDDEQAADMLKMLPDAFLWTSEGEKGSYLHFHFKPNPQFHPQDLEARVFAAMEGEMAIDREQHRIASVQGRLVHDVKIGFGFLGELKAGGTFDVERRELRPKLWGITETHVHIEGHALIFKTVSEQEDDVRSHFAQIADTTSMQQAQNNLLQQNPNPTGDRASHR